jgi:hypothetical protein
LPAAVAARMRRLADSISQEMIRLAFDLQADVRQGEDRAARGCAGRARASRDRAAQARLAKFRSLEPLR